MAEFVVTVTPAGGAAVEIKVGTVRSKRRPILRSTQLHRNGQSAVNKLSLHFSDSTVDRFLADNITEQAVTVTRDGDPWFDGLTRPASAQHKGHYTGQADVYDASYGLTSRITDSIGPWTSRSVSTAAGAGLIGSLLKEYGITAGKLDMAAVSETVLKFFVPGWRDVRWRTALGDVLKEFGWVLNVGPDGTWRMHDLYPPAVEPVAELGDDDMLSLRGIQRRTKDTRYGGYAVVWHPFETLTDQTIFDATPNDATIDVPAGEYYPPGASDTLATYSLYDLRETDGYDLIACDMQSLEWGGPGINLVMQDHFPLRSDVRFLAGSGGGEITRFRIKGRAFVKDELNERRSLTEAITDREIREVQAKYINTEAAAQRLSSGLALSSIYGSEQLRMDSPPGARRFAIDESYQINSPALSITNRLYRVTQVIEDDLGLQRVTLERLRIST